jgi:hypothetical protein
VCSSSLPAPALGSSDLPALRLPVRKKLRCYLRLHSYERRRTDEGTWYLECRHCGSFRNIPGPLPPAAGLS